MYVPIIKKNIWAGNSLSFDYIFYVNLVIVQIYILYIYYTRNGYKLPSILETNKYNKLFILLYLYS